MKSLSEEWRRVMETKTNQRTRILRELKDKRFVTNLDLNKICFRYSARLAELRKDGYNIQKEYERQGVFRYWLVPERELGDEY